MCHIVDAMKTKRRSSYMKLSPDQDSDNESQYGTLNDSQR